MTYSQEGELDLLVQSGQNTPCQVLQYIAVFILAGAVVGMQLETALPKTVGLKVVVQHADDGIGPFASVDRLIDQVVDLNYYY